MNYFYDEKKKRFQFTVKSIGESTSLQFPLNKRSNLRRIFIRNVNLCQYFYSSVYINT